MKSKILTNKNSNDVVNNNIIQICRYIGEYKYTKIILNSDTIGTTYGGTDDIAYVISPHEHPTQKKFSEEEIIHYHCWVNNRYKYSENMEKFDALYDFLYR